MSGNYALPSTFTIEFTRSGHMTYQLKTSQILRLQQEDTFSFFENPGNLFEITPDWLDFRLLDSEITNVFEGAEYNYTIKWLGLKLKWRSRIAEYRPPERFTDIQIIGPYRHWSHLHTFEKALEPSSYF
jgi:ligand-binding SRPBCC domain-containing protein